MEGFFPVAVFVFFARIHCNGSVNRDLARAFVDAVDRVFGKVGKHCGLAESIRALHRDIMVAVIEIFVALAGVDRASKIETLPGGGEFEVDYCEGVFAVHFCYFVESCE